MKALNKKTLFYRQDQILLENERLRHVMREMIVIANNTSSNELALIAIKKCLQHELAMPRYKHSSSEHETNRHTETTPKPIKVDAEVA